MPEHHLEKIAEELIASGEYRVLRKFHPQERYSANDKSTDTLVGCYLDLETTGLSATTDKIIEIGLVTFEFCADGRIFRILETYTAFEDPGMPIPEEITRLTGISNEMVQGHSIDRTKVREMIGPASVIVAHNSGFDRERAELFEPEFIEKAWTCSMRDIDWKSEGIGGTKLDYLAYRYGFFFDGHRATNDCLAGIHILAQPLPKTGVPALKAMLDCAREKEYRVWALGSHYDAKDALKARGYRWNGGENKQPRSWYIDLPGEALTAETNYLHREIYGREVELRIDIINAFNRYSSRI